MVAAVPGSSRAAIISIMDMYAIAPPRSQAQRFIAAADALETTMPPHPSPTDLVLLGAGHAHVEVLRRHARTPLAGVRLTLLTREVQTPYSGMLPGLVRGEHDFAACHIDCARLAAAAGVRLVVAEAAAIDLAGGRVGLPGGAAIGFDLLSVNIGGVPAMPAGAGVPVKPIGRFLAQLTALEADLPDGATLAVVGGGAGGAELALALATRLRGRAGILLVAGRALLPGAPAGVLRQVAAALTAAGIDILLAEATGYREGRLTLRDGRSMEVAAAVWATGVVAPPLLAASGLACDAAGCIVVAPTLRSVSHANVFAAGDCAAMLGAARPKSGVWAVRAGGILAGNLRLAVAGRALRPWRPQRTALVIIGTGGGRAVAWRGGWWLGGRTAWRWKDRIDRRWMAMYQRLRPMEMAAENLR